MKTALRGILTHSIALALVSTILPGIRYGGTLGYLILSAVVLGIANTFLKPVLSLILLPINIVTLGIIGLFMNTLLLFIVTLLVPMFEIVPFTLHLGNAAIPVSLVWSYVICSTALSLTAGFIRGIVNT